MHILTNFLISSIYIHNVVRSNSLQARGSQDLTQATHLMEPYPIFAIVQQHLPESVKMLLVMQRILKALVNML
jgi:hypothetical protein